MDELVDEAGDELDDAVDLAADAVDPDGELSLGGDLGMDFDPDGEDTEETVAADDGEFDLDDLDVNGEADTDLEVASETEAEDLGDFDFDGEGDADINATKIDLAEAYIDMGDGDGARDILNEVIEEGTEEQQTKAKELLSNIG